MTYKSPDRAGSHECMVHFNRSSGPYCPLTVVSDGAEPSVDELNINLSQDMGQEGEGFVLTVQTHTQPGIPGWIGNPASVIVPNQ